MRLLRLLPALLLVLSQGQALAGARPPKQERNTGPDLRPMSERWLDPDYTRVSSFEGKSFGTTAAYARSSTESRDSTKKFNTKGFNHRGNFVTGEYSTKEWSKAKQGWGNGDKKFATKEAVTDTGRVIPGTEEPYATKSLDKEDARDAKKQAASKTSRDDQRPFLVQGTRQEQLNAQSPQQGMMTVEQVKELLNKSK